MKVDKEELITRYRRLRDRVILRWVNHGRKRLKALEKSLPMIARNDKERSSLLAFWKAKQRLEKVQRAYWDTRFAKRPFKLLSGGPKNDRVWADIPRQPTQTDDFRGFGELNVDSPRYGLLKEPFYFLRLDNREYDRPVTFVIDEENVTIQVVSYVQPK